MKRTVFLFAGLLLSGTGLWGCGGVQGINAPTVVESQEAQEKKELVLAGIDLDSGICLAVTAFNQLSDDTVVILRNYGDGSGVVSDTVQGRIYGDVINGDIPDMYMMSPTSVWPLDRLNAQGVFVDLYPFLDSDPRISRDDLFSTVLETVQRDDTLFYFPVSYTLNGIWGVPEYCNGNRFPVDRISGLRQLFPQHDMLFGAFTPMDLINMEVSQNPDLYVNWKIGTCDFTSRRFLDTLEAACDLPKYRPAGREEMMDYAAGVYLLEGRQFFAPYTISDFESYLMKTEDVAFHPYGGDMVSVTLTDSQVVLDIRSAFAITSACGDPETAWQFLRTFLEMEYQQSLPTATAPALPVNVHAFTAETDKLLAENKGTEAGFVRILELVESARAVTGSTDIRIESMISEAVSACFSGQKTVKETARMIQDQVSAYLMED